MGNTESEATTMTTQALGPDETESLGAAAIAQVEAHAAHNYHPLPVVLARGEGAFVWDADGRRYLDMLAGYSALNFGHRHPRLVAAVEDQLGRLTLTSRAFHNDLLGAFAEGLTALAGMDMMLPMNTGAEAVETALKMARKWGYERKGVPDGRAKIVVMGGNFHGRTTTIVGFSDDPSARDGFGPFTPGFVRVPFGDAAALAAAIDEDTVGVLLEPIQGEGGVILPPDGYLRAVRQLCTERNVLMLADEIQSGLGRTGYTFASEHESVVPDAYILGKALGGGILPVSAVVSRREVMEVFRPGGHGSTFGGNPLACAVGIEVVRMLQTGEYQARARALGEVLAAGLAALPASKVAGFRVRGLWAGVDIVGRTGRDVCEGLMRRGILAKDTHGSTIRLAPPLVIERSDLEWAIQQLADELEA
jgi:ornithine--oxo-acid transaminase